MTTAITGRQLYNLYGIQSEQMRLLHKTLAIILSTLKNNGKRKS